MSLWGRKHYARTLIANGSPARCVCTVVDRCKFPDGFAPYTHVQQEQWHRHRGDTQGARFSTQTQNDRDKTVRFTYISMTVVNAANRNAAKPWPSAWSSAEPHTPPWQRLGDARATTMLKAVPTVLIICSLFIMLFIFASAFPPQKAHCSFLGVHRLRLDVHYKRDRSLWSPGPSTGTEAVPRSTKPHPS